MLDQARTALDLAGRLVEHDLVFLGQIPEVAGELLLVLDLAIGDPTEDVAIREARVERATRGERTLAGGRDQLLDERLDGLGLGHGGLDLAVLEEAGSEVAQHGPAVIRLDAQLLS